MLTGKDYAVSGPTVPAGFTMTLTDVGVAEGAQEKIKAVYDRQSVESELARSDVPPRQREPGRRFHPGGAAPWPGRTAVTLEPSARLCPRTRGPALARAQNPRGGERT